MDAELARKCGQDYVDQRFAWTPTLVYVDTELAARAGKKQVRLGVLSCNKASVVTTLPQEIDLWRVIPGPPGGGCQAVGAGPAAPCDGR